MFINIFGALGLKFEKFSTSKSFVQGSNSVKQIEMVLKNNLEIYFKYSH